MSSPASMSSLPTMSPEQSVNEESPGLPEAAGWREGWLRPRDQPTVTILALACLALVAWGWWRRGGGDGSWCDVDAAPALTARFQVDVNRAAWPELSQLPRIGPILALRWIADREAHGPYAAHGDLQRIPGIGPRTLAEMLPYLAPIDVLEARAPKR